MSPRIDQVDHRDQVAVGSQDKRGRRDVSDHLQGWLDAEEAIRRLRFLTHRVAELELQVEQPAAAPAQRLPTRQEELMHRARELAEETRSTVDEVLSQS